MIDFLEGDKINERPRPCRRRLQSDQKEQESVCGHASEGTEKQEDMNVAPVHRGILIPSARSAADSTVARAFVWQKVFTFVAARANCSRSTTVLRMLEL